MERKYDDPNEGNAYIENEVGVLVVKIKIREVAGGKNSCRLEVLLECEAHEVINVLPNCSSDGELSEWWCSDGEEVEEVDLPYVTCVEIFTNKNPRLLLM